MLEKSIPSSNIPLKKNDNNSDLFCLPMSRRDIFFSFEGRIPRKVYWINGVLILSLFFILSITAIYVLVQLMGDWAKAIVLIPYFFSVWASLAIGIKRWHDRDKSGWWMLISFIPIIGGLWLIIESGFIEGTEGENRYGLPWKKE
jgi:uncharacterized membrane protein YhaH (DUF805 family)